MLNEAKLKQVMAAVLRIDPAELGEDASADTIESWDSLKHLNLVWALEEEFQVAIPGDDVDRITSYRLVRLVLTELLEGR